VASLDAPRGCIAMVTGAGRCCGIGAAICRSLAAEGADVFFTFWNKRVV